MPPRKKSAKRKGGPKPGAVTEKELIGQPLEKLLPAAEFGRFSTAIAEKGYQIAALKELIIRTNALSDSERNEMLLDAGLPSPMIADDYLVALKALVPHSMQHSVCVKLDQDPERAVRVANDAARELLGWLVHATPKDLRDLAHFMECCPLIQDETNCGALRPRPADEQLLNVFFRASGSPALPPPTKSEKVLANKILGLKRKPGRPKRNRSS